VEIVRTKAFDRDVERLGLTSEDMDGLLGDLAKNPEAGDPIRGLRGVRKARFGIPSRRIGKRGGGRVIYVLIRVRDALVLLMAYGKAEKDDLSNADRRALLAIVESLTED
jgi:hypothetical protein